MDIEVRHLRAFSTVAEQRSYTAASRLLLITQPALTRTVQQLEQRLDVQLLKRSSRSVELTAAGQAFLQRARSILRDFDLAVAEARNEHTLRVGFSWVLPDPWASDVIADFEQDTKGSVRLMRRDDLAEALERGEIDIALTRHQIVLNNATTLTLFTEPRVAAVSTRWPLAKQDRLSWNELAKYPLIINTISGGTRIEMWGEAERPTEVVECQNYDEWTALVASGRGAGSIAQSAATASTHSGIAILPLDDAPPAGLWLSYLPGRPSALLRRFIDAATTRR